MVKRTRTPEYFQWQRKYKSEQIKKLKLQAIEQLGGECVSCHTKSDLELDHIDRKTKTFPISRPPSEKAFWQEIKKCQILCKPCHRIKSTKEHQGDNCPHAKLTSEQIKEIRKELLLGCKGSELSRKYGVSVTHISKIKNKKRWGHIE